MARRFFLAGFYANFWEVMSYGRSYQGYNDRAGRRYDILSNEIVLSRNEYNSY